MYKLQTWPNISKGNYDLFDGLNSTFYKADGIYEGFPSLLGTAKRSDWLVSSDRLFGIYRVLGVWKPHKNTTFNH